jgi:type II secretory pathway pseudopilin PulG
MPSGRPAQAGFAYLLLLIVIALIGIAASASLSAGATISRRDSERELLALGLEFQQGLRSYAGAPAAVTQLAGSGPRNLEDLLRDPRAAGIRRHLRQVYHDPLTGKNEWGLVRDKQGNIIGIYSIAAGRPIKRTGFETALGGFDEAESYRQWVFGLPEAQRGAAAALR